MSISAHKLHIHRLLLGLILIGAFHNFTLAQKTTRVFAKKPGWKDEFNYQGKPDTNKWNYDLGCNWYNDEVQCYTNRPENVRVENGHLTIEARHEKMEHREYTSTRLLSKGKGDFVYGRFDVRAKLPRGIGTWPAIWLLFSDTPYGNRGWPENGEIDIMEHVGFDPDHVHGTIHCAAFNHVQGTQKGTKKSVKGLEEEFHTFRCDWTPNNIKIFVDDQEYFSFDKPANATWKEWPFDHPHHLILNIAVGGGWGGQKGIDPKAFPAKMEIDYVRYYPLK
ncbi:Licheninase [Haliscomenobacter hydrossis DSM 1100]|uniref:Licheninase n=1 Tax=Haliscomenobacter hydrossis (strain ATCC 27775 / DSM 1100 / LMG 10767 / O) TaxID=760192 RepID=F4KSJ5_HALH1|nr:Licheninase [Haliscomenobacter hydrossis DSM 1100]